MEATAHAGDAIDQRRIRIAWTAVASVAAAGIAGVFVLWFIDAACARLDCDFGALQYFGLLFAWPPVAAIVTGRLVWRRGFGDKIVVVALFAWFVLHLVAPLTFFFAYRDTLGLADGAWGALAVWLGLGILMVAATWFAADLLERVR